MTAPVFLLIVNIMLLILGCLLEGTTILLIIVPIFIPTAKALGIDLVHFGVVVVVNIMIGLLTPPFGLLLFVLKGVSPPGTTMRDIYLAGMPFIACVLLLIAVIIVFPPIATWLPALGR
jgi:TRAP-type mannitol/chloroaromatic compound transport system permease large subunit